MPPLERVSISLEQGLWEKLEALRQREGYANRSEFIRDLIRARLVREAEEGADEAVGAVTLVYRHHTRGLGARLTAIQHRFEHHIISSCHVHLDHHHCLEVILVRGPVGVLRELERELKKHKGVLHGELSLTASAELLR
ncbi:MAG: nickel-responsive transcriptional regulator NikR [Thermoanaerobaculum sp.]|nr:nickel-responsive transcriptional regulator NikR [Thermoanaerobaculum sp.]MDW7967078.1 nickel-responsive transcriptional regulator NikR [Thermoanaerobaculum sp.]